MRRTTSQNNESGLTWGRVLAIGVVAGVIAGALGGYLVAARSQPHPDPTLQVDGPREHDSVDHESEGVGSSGSPGVVEDEVSSLVAVHGENEGFGSSASATIGDAHAELLTHGGSLILGQVTTLGEADESTVELAVSEVLWATEGSSPPSPVAVARINAGPRDSARLAEFAGEDVIALITTDRRIIGLAPLGPGGDLFGPRTDDLFYLAWVAEWMVESRFTPVVEDACATAVTPDPDRSELEALTDYFTTSGEETWFMQMTAVAVTRTDAEEIALEVGTFTDPVTGIPVRASLNHLMRQLAAGVARPAIDVRPTVPLLITVPEDEMTDNVLVFYDATTREWLGWVGAGPQRGGSGEVFTTKRVHLEPPDDGHDVAVTLQKPDDLSECPMGATQEALVIVPSDDIAGTRRARIDIANGTYSNASAADFEAVKAGTFEPPVPTTEEDSVTE